VGGRPPGAGHWHARDPRRGGLGTELLRKLIAGDRDGRPQPICAKPGFHLRYEEDSGGVRAEFDLAALHLGPT
jgi:hypothetical protein